MDQPLASARLRRSGSTCRSPALPRCDSSATPAIADWARRSTATRASHRWRRRDPSISGSAGSTLCPIRHILALCSHGTYQAFDIDVANEVGRRFGVTVEYAPPDWTAITAGGWGGRWDMSVGSMTITPDRAKVLDFSPPYYFTPAQMAASTASGITT